MNAIRVPVLVGVWVLALSGALAAQTTVYQAAAGTVSPSLVITMRLDGGGVATLNPVVGPNCYLGRMCRFPAGYVGTSMSYVLPDGSSATLTDFHGALFPWGSAYLLVGRASGTDSFGRGVTVGNVRAGMRIRCRSGRGGGCSKVYTGGALALAVNQTPPPTPTPTSTVVPGPAETPVPVGQPTTTPSDSGDD